MKESYHFDKFSENAVVYSADSNIECTDNKSVLNLKNVTAFLNLDFITFLYKFSLNISTLTEIPKAFEDIQNRPNSSSKFFKTSKNSSEIKL